MKKKNLFIRIVLGAALVLLAALSTLPMLPPIPAAAEIPASRFSAERAMADLAVCGRW